MSDRETGDTRPARAVLARGRSLSAKVDPWPFRARLLSRAGFPVLSINALEPRGSFRHEVRDPPPVQGDRLPRPRVGETFLTRSTMGSDKTIDLDGAGTRSSTSRSRRPRTRSTRASSASWTRPVASRSSTALQGLRQSSPVADEPRPSGPGASVVPDSAVGQAPDAVNSGSRFSRMYSWNARPARRTMRSAPVQVLRGHASTPGRRRAIA